MSTVILSTAYFPSIQYCSKLIEHKHVTIESQEHYQKQSYRNRCRILGPNGVQSLSIPIERGRSREIPIKDIQIDYSMPWQGNHYRSIITAYQSAPYFDHYLDDFRVIWEKKTQFLFDLNMTILEKLSKILKLNKQIEVTQEFQKESNAIDFRNSIHPKTRMQSKDLSFEPADYMQVFMEKFDFVPNLSMLDLIMNEGPMSKSILEKSLTK